MERHAEEGVPFVASTGSSETVHRPGRHRTLDLMPPDRVRKDGRRRGPLDRVMCPDPAGFSFVAVIRRRCRRPGRVVAGTVREGAIA
jgi:hypothetical protein